MRRFPVRCEIVRVSSVDGERRRISVSGLAKPRMLWLFRNFSILDFRVLSRKQQQLIARMWLTSGPGTITRDDPFDLIGTVDGFLPKLFPATVPRTRTSRRLVHFDLPKARRAPVIWALVGGLLLGSAMLLLPMYRTTQSHVTAVAVVRPVNATLSRIARISVAQVEPVTHQPVAAPLTPRPLRLPGAMALNESSPLLKQQPAPVVVRTKPRGTPEVMIRVSVDRQGRASTFHIVQGDQKHIAAALTAAKRWHFQPCADSAECEHLLKYTDHGDASTLQGID